MEQLFEYAGNHPYLFGAAVVALLAVVVFEMRARAHAFAGISPQQLIQLQNQGAAVFDIRPKEQYAAGHISGAKQIPSDQILKASETLKKYKDKTLIVYDDTGSLSSSAARQLAAQGFTRAFSLKGGLAAWRAENLPLTKS